MSLKYKFVITLVALVFILTLSFGFLSVKRLEAELEAQLIERGRVIANELIKRLEETTEDTIERFSSAPPSEDRTLLTLLQQFQRNFLSVGQSIIELAGGEVKYISTQNRWGRVSTGRAPTVLGPSSRSLGLEVTRARGADGTNYLLLRKPLRAEGYVELALDLSFVRGRVQNEILVISLVGTGFVFLAVLIAFGLYQMILSPIEELTKGVKLFSRRRDARVQLRSGDELELLGQEFNKMADSIEERNRQLEQINAELTRANRVKSEFLAVMGHELKTPLHAIRGYSQLLLEAIDGPLTRAQQQDLENILTSGDHLLELIDNILRFSKLEAGEEKFYSEEIDAGRVVDEAIRGVQGLARERGLVIESRVLPCRLHTDGTKLKQVLINLLSNALKYSRRGTITVTAEPQNAVVQFAVSDTGTGIPREHHEKIFEPFAQLDSSTTREASGIGLGLAIVKKYVEMQGGRVWLESEPGRGSTFYFTVAQSAPAAAPPTPAQPQRVATS